MIKKICSFPCCSSFAMDGSCYCEKHYKPRVPFEGAVRANEALYRTARWRALRNKVLEAEPYCCVCGSTVDLTVDHKIPPRGDEELFFDFYNLQVLCRDCHRIKTNNEIFSRKS